MNDRDRLGQLGGLLARLERMPASAGRDWMLAEVRGRAVDVETGMAPTPLRALPRDEAQASLAAEQAPRADQAPPPAPVKRPRTTPSRRAPRGRVVAPVCMPPVRDRERSREEVVDLLGMDGVLNLDDSPTAASDASRPWARGLRG
jgi:hypothetical protein